MSNLLWCNWVKMEEVGCGDGARLFKVPKAFEFCALPTTVFGRLSEANAPVLEDSSWPNTVVDVGALATTGVNTMFPPFGAPSLSDTTGVTTIGPSKFTESGATGVKDMLFSEITGVRSISTSRLAKLGAPDKEQNVGAKGSPSQKMFSAGRDSPGLKILSGSGEKVELGA